MEGESEQDKKDQEIVVAASAESQNRKRKGKRRLEIDMGDFSSQDVMEGSGMSLRVRQATDNSRVRICQTCPVCDSIVKASEMHQHCNVEIERLKQLTESRFGAASKSRKRKQPKDTSSSSQISSETSQNEECSTTEAAQSLIDKTKRNRHRRCIRGSIFGSGLSRSVACPVCGLVVDGDIETIYGHVDECLRTQSSRTAMSDNSESDGESFEEYTWAGQQRVRASAMLEGKPLGTVVSASSTADVDNDVDLDVEGEACLLGKPQYTEADVIPCEADEPKEERERQALRGAVLSMLPTASSKVTRDDSSELVEYIPDETLFPGARISIPAYAENNSERLTVLLNILKKRIAEQERQLQSQTIRCLICMEPYNKPVVSITCWHVYCEGCWLQSLGMKKVCPQCNVITSPADLRRIFL